MTHRHTPLMTLSRKRLPGKVVTVIIIKNYINEDGKSLILYLCGIVSETASHAFSILYISNHLTAISLDDK